MSSVRSRLSAEKDELFPVFLKLSQQRCLVVGAGKTIDEKIPTLLTCGARVTIVAHHVLGLDLRSVEHLFTRLHFHVVSDGLLAAWAEYHERAEDMLRKSRPDRAFVLELGLRFLLSHAMPKGETVFNL